MFICQALNYKVFNIFSTKQENDCGKLVEIWEHSVRNYFLNGGGKNYMCMKCPANQIIANLLD